MHVWGGSDVDACLCIYVFVVLDAGCQEEINGHQPAHNNATATDLIEEKEEEEEREEKNEGTTAHSH